MTFLSVLLILAVLTVSVSVTYLATDPTYLAGQVKVTIQRLQTLRLAINLYKVQHGSATPAILDDLVTPNLPACSVNTIYGSQGYQQKSGWCGPYVDRTTLEDPNSYKTDSWGTLIQFNALKVFSCGPDRVCGNSDDITILL